MRIPVPHVAKAIALTAALAMPLTLGACQHPDGSTDWGSTLALGAGVGLAGAAVAALASDGGNRNRYRQPRGHDGGYYGQPRGYRPAHANGYGGGYNRRAW